MATKRVTVPSIMRDKVLTDAGYKCGNPICTHELSVEVHHIEEVSQGGGNAPNNLLPLCPYCHSKYHDGWIPAFAIKQWKQRLNVLNSPIDLRLTTKIVAEVRKTLGVQPNDFARATSEFAARTCKIGVEKSGNVIVKGYGTFVKEGLMLTTDSVTENVTELIEKDGGKAVVWSDVGLAEFEPFSSSDLTHAVIIKVSEFDTDHARQAAAESKVPFDVAFTLPLQTEVPARHMPALGEVVAFLHSPSQTEGLRMAGTYQFERLDVSYRQFHREAKNIVDFTLSQLMTPLSMRVLPSSTSKALWWELLQE